MTELTKIGVGREAINALQKTGSQFEIRRNSECSGLNLTVGENVRLHCSSIQKFLDVKVIALQKQGRVLQVTVQR